MAINLTSPSVYSSILIGDRNSGNLSFTQVAGVPASAILELQTTEGAFIVPRMTSVQRDAMTVTPGMLIYNTTSAAFNFREGANWHDITAGSVNGPGSSTDRSIAVWNGINGNLLTDTPVLIDESGNLEGINSLINAVGSELFPTYTFENAPDTGMWSSADNFIDFSAFGTRQLQISGVAAAENYVKVKGSAAGVGSPTITIDGADANVDLVLQAKGTGGVFINGTGVEPAILKMRNATNTHTTDLVSANVAADLVLTLPSADSTVITGATAMFTPLSTNGSGALAFRRDLQCTASGSITSAQILDLNANPVLILDRPGGTSSIIVDKFILEYTYGGTQYTAGENLILVYLAGNHASSDITSVFLTQASSAIMQASGTTLGGGAGLTPLQVRDQPIYLALDGGAVDYADGNGTLKWFCTFTILST
jgi:hypothetical protein